MRLYRVGHTGTYSPQFSGLNSPPSTIISTFSNFSQFPKFRNNSTIRSSDQLKIRKSGNPLPTKIRGYSKILSSFIGEHEKTKPSTTSTHAILSLPNGFQSYVGGPTYTSSYIPHVISLSTVKLR